jgi:crossover junction endodeoxyribonuclease RuvC
VNKLSIIIGIDPGYHRTGYGIIEKKGNRFEALEYGCIETSPKKTLLERYFDIEEVLNQILDDFSIDIFSIEKLFFNNNVKTAIEVAQARGIMLLVAHKHDLIIREFTPIQIKQGVTGYGRAEKSQVQKMVKSLLSLSEIPKPDDTADALATAICAANSNNYKEMVV